MRQAISATRRQIMMNAGKIAMALTAASSEALLPAIAHGQDNSWPNKPLRMIVPFAAGSLTDLIARIMSDGFTKALGQPVVVENKPGANGLIGCGEVARSAPDGYTLLVTNSSSITINPQLYAKSLYKTADFTPITEIVKSPFILVVNPAWAQKNKIATLNDLFEFARANPGALSYGSAGPGNVAHLSYAMLSNRAKVQTTHVPYKGAGLAQMAVLSGEIQSVFDTWSALPFIQAGKLKALAVSSNQRMSQLPDVPTIEETGMPDFNVTFWIGMVAPAGTPSHIVRKLFALIQVILDNPQARATLNSQGEVVLMDPLAFAKSINHDVPAWAAVIQRENLKLD